MTNQRVSRVMKTIKSDKTPAQTTFGYFLRDTKDHNMTVLMDSGVYRHLSFSRNGSSDCKFELVTWPGHLSISGDMGSFTFSRLHDMFEFFRTDRRRRNLTKFDPEQTTNLGYWAEKLVAVDRYGFQELSGPKIKQHVLGYIEDEEYLKERYGEESWAEIKEEIDDLIEHIECRSNYEMQELVQEIYEFDKNGFQFTDFFENNLNDYTHHFMWACAAIAYGVQEYDLKRKAEAIHEVATINYPDGSHMPPLVGPTLARYYAKPDFRAMHLLPENRGAYLICGLNEEDTKKVESGEIRSHHSIWPKNCVPFDAATSYYLMGIYAYDGAGKEISEALASLMQTLPDRPVYADPATQDGLNWMHKNGFSKISGTGGAMKSSTKAIARDPQPQPAAKTKKSSSPSI